MPASQRAGMYSQANCCTHLQGTCRVGPKFRSATVLRSGTVSWVLRGEEGARHPLSLIIGLGLKTPRKKERNQ